MLTVAFAVLAVIVAESIQAAEAARIREALRYADISPDKAAAHMAMDRSQFNRQLAGEGHVSHTRLLLLPPDWWQWYHVIGVQDVGLPPRLANMPRMAKMTLPTAAVERERAK